MSLSNNAVMAAAASFRFISNDCHSGSGSGSQTKATPIKGNMVRFVVSAGGADSAILPTVGTGDGAPVVIVVNDSAGNLNVYPGVGEATNGTANAGTTIAAGKSAVFFRVGNGLSPGTAGGWAGGVIG